MKKKILYISLRSGYGGATMHIDQLIKYFTTKYEVFCAAPIEIPFGTKWKTNLGNSKYLELPYRSFSIKFFIRLIQFIKKNKMDIVHAHGKGAGIYVRLAKIFTPGVYLIFTFHGLHTEIYSVLQKYIYIFLERILGKLTNKFINVSNGEKQRCLDNKLFNETKSVVIYNALENDESIYPAKDELRKKLNLPIDKFIIISVLRFDPAKNISAMLDIALKLSKDNKYLFILLGDGEEKAFIERKLKEIKIKNLKLFGYKKNVTEFLHASDLFLSTSLWEGLPYSLIEATQAGIPIVASNVTGNNEVVIDKHNGCLFQINDSVSAADLIRELSESDETIKLFGQNSKKVFKEKFTLDKMLKKIEGVYSNAV